MPLAWVKGFAERLPGQTVRNGVGRAVVKARPGGGTAFAFPRADRFRIQLAARALWRYRREKRSRPSCVVMTMPS